VFTIKRLALAVLGLALFAIGITETLDPDMWWHLRTGEVILTSGIPRVDIFSFSMLGSPWITHEWFSQVFMWFLYSRGGFPCIIVVFALLGVLTFSFVYYSCEGRPYLALLLTLLSYATTKLVWGARPQIFNIFMLALFIWLLTRIRNKKTNWKWLYIFPLFIGIWVNFHSGYLMGVVLLATYLLGDFLEGLVSGPQKGRFGKQELQHLVWVIPLCFLFSLMNPQGYHLWAYPFETLASPVMQTQINEWQSPDFHDRLFWPFLITLGLGVASFMLPRRRTTLTDAILFIGTLSISLISRRHIPFFAIVAIPILSRNIMSSCAGTRWNEFFCGQPSLSGLPKMAQALHWVIALAGILGVSFWAHLKIEDNDHAIAKTYPVEAVKFLEQKKLDRARGFHEYTWGGYLIWKGVPVFIDGRGDMYGDKFLSGYLDTYRLNTDWDKAGDQYKIDYVLIESGAPLKSVLRLNPKWKEIYSDKVTVIFLKKSF
jgi:hypothetical protein